MENYNGQNAVAALLAEYKKATQELQKVIEDLEVLELTKIVDDLTNNPECKSIQTVLTHVVGAEYS